MSNSLALLTAHARTFPMERKRNHPGIFCHTLRSLQFALYMSQQNFRPMSEFEKLKTGGSQTGNKTLDREFDEEKEMKDGNANRRIEDPDSTEKEQEDLDLVDNNASQEQDSFGTMIKKGEK